MHTPKMDTVYIAGPPGSGKSTLMAALTAGCERHAQTGPPAHDLLVRPDGYVAAAELGRRRERFPGTDALPYNIQPKVTDWLKMQPWPLVLGEGQRLGNRNFLREASAVSTFHLIHLSADLELLACRKDARGSEQNWSWIKGATTAAANLLKFAREQGVDTIEINAELSTEDQAGLLFEYLPELNVLRV